ncbi:MAG: SDR family oxidoreductase [Elusimicrobiota bacterium]
MKIIFTGSGSFTGYWIIKKLVEDGHEVYSLLEEQENLSSGIRGERIKKLAGTVKCFFNTPYSKPEFFNFLSEIDKVDFFCHHFFDTKDYKSPDYNIISALSNSVGDIKALFTNLKRIGCRYFILTGSSFEPNEGVEGYGSPAFSPYGLSKSLAFQIFSYYSKINGIKFSKFVIPNPFGPLEEYKFTSYLADTWLKGGVPVIKTPDYVRDNIPVDLLSIAYSQMVSDLASGKELTRFSPSGYVENNLAFVGRMSKELSSRLGIKCKFVAEKHTDFSEPLSRYNADNMFVKFPNYSESSFWDKLALYYDESFRVKI